MAVNLKLIQAPAIKPQPPVWWMWLLLLGVMLLAGTVGTILNSTAKPQINANAFCVGTSCIVLACPADST